MVRASAWANANTRLVVPFNRSYTISSAVSECQKKLTKSRRFIGILLKIISVKNEKILTMVRIGWRAECYALLITVWYFLVPEGQGSRDFAAAPATPNMLRYRHSTIPSSESGDKGT